jgi:hypothetical protein
MRTRYLLPAVIVAAVCVLGGPLANAQTKTAQPHVSPTTGGWGRSAGTKGWMYERV